MSGTTETTEASRDVTFTTSDGKTFVAPTLQFDGPLDLLLFLIQQSKINIYDIPIAQITDQFLAYLDKHQDMDLATLSGFYKMASQLLAIKSRMLLPVDVEFDEEYEDPRKELVDQLIEYQKFKKYTQLLSGGAGGEFVMMRKENDFFLPFTDEELFKDVTAKTLMETFARMMRTINAGKVFNVFESVTEGEKIALIDELLETHEEITLSMVIVHMDSKMDIICAFLAILECCKWQKISIAQSEPYGEIVIRKKAAEEEVGPQLADQIDDEYDAMIEKGWEKADEETRREGLDEDKSVTYDEQPEEDISLDDDDEEDS